MLYDVDMTPRSVGLSKKCFAQLLENGSFCVFFLVALLTFWSLFSFSQIATITHIHFQDGVFGHKIVVSCGVVAIWRRLVADGVSGFCGYFLFIFFIIIFVIIFINITLAILN